MQQVHFAFQKKYVHVRYKLEFKDWKIEGSILPLLLDKMNPLTL